MVLVAALLSCAFAPLLQTEFVVSPQGSDANPGTRPRPFKSLERARDAVRTVRRESPNLRAPIFVDLERGTYSMHRPLVLTPEDSATQASPTVFRGNHATLSGGRTITGFHVDNRGWWRTILPEVKTGAWRFSQLFVNGRRRFRPRFPKDGYYNIAAEMQPSPAAKGHGFDRFGFRAGDIDPNWHNPSDVELLCFHIWDMSRMRIGAVDMKTNSVTTTGPTGYDAGWANFPKGNRYIIENVREALSAPGEWYVDNESGELTYVPMPGEDPSRSIVTAPVAERLIEIKGNVSEHRYVDSVRFENINFECANWTLPPQGRFFPQAEVDLGAAIHAEGWREGAIRNCTVQHVGEYAIELSGGCKNVAIDGCNLTDLGAGGVKIGETRQYNDEGDTAQSVTVHNCLIAHGGRLHPAAIGVWIGQSSHNEISHNDIFDFYYTGVSVGWTWGYSKSEAHDNLIAYNHIHSIGQGVLSDMGGIYTLGVEPGTKLIGNRIHDIDSFSYGGWGIYPDEGSSHELIENNVVYRTKSGGFHQHYGQENIVDNNIIAFAREAEVIRTRAEDHLSFTFEHNIVYWKDAPLLGSNWSGNNYKLDGNLYWRTDGKPIDFAGMSLDGWRAKGQDHTSAIADPQFVDPLQGDFRLKRTSPAFALGFRDFDQSLAGLTTGRPKDKEPFPPAFPLKTN